MTGESAERFVHLNLLLMAGGFALVGFFFIAWPDGMLARLSVIVAQRALKLAPSSCIPR